MELQRFKFDTGLLENGLRKGLSDETVSILEITSDCFSAKGLNFFSDLFKASVSYTTSNLVKNMESEHTINVIIKTEPASEISKDIVRRQGLHFIELRIYRDVLPKIQEIVGCQIGPRLWYGSNNPPMLIMEDLSKRGFVMKDRVAGLAFNHCCLVIERIAKWHAGSVAMYEKDPEAIKSFRSGIMSSKYPAFMARFIEVSLLKISEAIEKWPEEQYVRVAAKLKKLAKTSTARCCDVYNYDQDEFCVLTHGDCWVNNLMFKENDDGEPIDVLLVDYQMSCYSSPAIDLLYFINTCPEISMRCEKYDVFLDVYLNILKTTMTNIGCKTKAPTMKQLKQAIHKRRIHAIFSGLVLYLRMIGNKEDIEDIETLAKLQCGTNMDVFKSANAVKAAHKIIPMMDERGYFD